MVSTTLHQAGPVQGPAWDLSDEYPAATAQEVDAELQSLSDLVQSKNSSSLTQASLRSAKESTGLSQHLANS